MTHAGGLQIQFSCGSLAVEMAMEMESYLVGPKKRWRTLLSNAIPKYTCTLGTYPSTEYSRASNSQDSRDKKAWDQ